MDDLQKHIAGAKKGHQADLEFIYNHYKVTLFKLCRLYVNDRMTAEDLLQEGFIRVFDKLKKYDPKKGPFTPWIRKVFVNVCLAHLRKSKAKFMVEELNEIILDIDTRFERNAISNLSLQEIYSLINSIPEGYRMVFNLYVVEGYNHREIGELLGISENTSKSQLFKAKKTLQRLVSSHFPDYANYHGKAAETYK